MSQLHSARARFSIKARGKSFRYAYDGMFNFFNREHNAVLHLLATVLSIFLAVILHISKSEVIALALVIGFVWVCELFNTAIEKTMNLISVEKSPDIKFIKDISAAAVLIAAVTALIVGCIIFIPKL